MGILMIINNYSYNVGPPLDSQVGAKNSNFTMVYGTQITIVYYSYGGL